MDKNSGEHVLLRMLEEVNVVYLPIENLLNEFHIDVLVVWGDKDFANVMLDKKT